MAHPARRARGQAHRAGLLAAILTLAAAAACANTGDPPGGPPDEKPPVILGVYPESGAVLTSVRGDAVIQFDGVIDEMAGGGASGTSGLAARILLSPTAGAVKVSWHRSAVHVKPAEGWKRDRVYQLQLLPGIVDLRRNVMKTGRTVVFSTGPEIPHARLAGTGVQWVEQQALRGGLIRAARLPDTLAYLAVTDSAGNFRLDNLAPGRYAVFAIQDQNGNHARDRREPYDSALVTLDSSATVVLWTFAHDTTGPRLRQAEAGDSVTARLTFSQPLDPALPLESLSVRVRALPDSTPLRVRRLLTPARYDSLTAQARAAADSARAAQDTTPKDTTRRRPTPGVAPDTSARAPRAPRAPAPPRQAQPAQDTLRLPPGARRAAAQGAESTPDTAALRSILRQRPVPQDKLVLQLDTILTPGGRYTIEVRGARNLTGARADSHTTLTVPKPKPPAPADTARARRDSTRP